MDSRYTIRYLLRGVGALFVALIAGCSGEQTEEDLAELEILPITAQQAEVDLGRFNIPFPLAMHSTGGGEAPNQLQIQFHLYGLVSPEAVLEVERLRDLRAGELRDRVIRTCRNIVIHELQDPDLSTLKLRILDIIQPLFDGTLLHSVLMSDVMIEPL